MPRGELKQVRDLLRAERESGARTRLIKQHIAVLFSLVGLPLLIAAFLFSGWAYPSLSPASLDNPDCFCDSATIAVTALSGLRPVGTPNKDQPFDSSISRTVRFTRTNDDKLIAELHVHVGYKNSEHITGIAISFPSTFKSLAPPRIINELTGPGGQIADPSPTENGHPMCIESGNVDKNEGTVIREDPVSWSAHNVEVADPRTQKRKGYESYMTCRFVVGQATPADKRNVYFSDVDLAWTFNPKVNDDKLSRLEYFNVDPAQAMLRLTDYSPTESKLSPKVQSDPAGTTSKPFWQIGGSQTTVTLAGFADDAQLLPGAGYRGVLGPGYQFTGTGSSSADGLEAEISELGLSVQWTTFDIRTLLVNLEILISAMVGAALAVAADTLLEADRIGLNSGPLIIAGLLCALAIVLSAVPTNWMWLPLALAILVPIREVFRRPAAWVKAKVK